MIRCPQPNVAIDGPAEAGQDYVKVIRPINDPGKEEVEFEPPEEEQFGVRNPRKMLDPKLPSQREIDEHCFLSKLVRPLRCR